MKYIMFKCKTKVLTQFIPVIFPCTLVHSEVSQQMRKVLPKHPGAIWEVHSAGEIDMFGKVSGKSETLNMGHDPHDESRILMADYGGLFEYD